MQYITNLNPATVQRGNNEVMVKPQDLRIGDIVTLTPDPIIKGHTHVGKHDITQIYDFYPSPEPTLKGVVVQGVGEGVITVRTQQGNTTYLFEFDRITGRRLRGAIKYHIWEPFVP
jgi:hypothetical protein